MIALLAALPDARNLITRSSHLTLNTKYGFFSRSRYSVVLCSLLTKHISSTIQGRLESLAATDSNPHNLWFLYDLSLLGSYRSQRVLSLKGIFLAWTHSQKASDVLPPQLEHIRLSCRPALWYWCYLIKVYENILVHQSFPHLRNIQLFFGGPCKSLAEHMINRPPRPLAGPKLPPTR
jgi:hypothetical protein